jgi:hypothetical protein
MQTVQWRPEINTLTNPPSYRPRCIPRSIAGYDDIAAQLALKNPTCSVELIKSIMMGMMDEIMAQLINGNQVTLTNAFTFRLSLNGRLESPDAPLPPINEALHVRVSASRPCIEAARQVVQLERLAMSEKLPLINAATDTVLKLNDVLNTYGALHLLGSELLFTPDDDSGECVLEGTRNGKIVQSRFTKISNTEITFLPDIPSQTSPWNNEYTLSIATRYTEHGTQRIGIYHRKLRTPLLVTGFGQPNQAVGILTGSAAAPYVLITGGTLSTNATLRIQVVYDQSEVALLFNLLDMSEGGKQGTAVKVTEDGMYELTGFTGSVVTSLVVAVNNFTDLVHLTRNSYSGRLVDVLQLVV